jgi:hypothetical protein
MGQARGLKAHEMRGRPAGALPGGDAEGPKGRLTRLEKDLIASRGKKRDPVCRSNCCRRRTSSMSWPTATIASPRQ